MVKHPAHGWRLVLAACMLAAALTGSAALAGEEAPAPPAGPTALERIDAEYKAFVEKHAEDNAAIHYLQAMLKVSQLQLRARDENAREIENFVRSTLQQAPPEILGDYPEAAAAVRELADPAVTSLRRGARMKRCCFDSDWASGPAIQLPHLARARDLARGAIAYGKLLEHEKRPAEAAEVYLDVVRMGLHLGEDPMVISELVGVAVTWMGLRAIESMLARGVDEETGRSILEGLRAVPSKPFDMSEAVEAERIVIGGWAKSQFLRAAESGRDEVIKVLKMMLGRELKFHEQLLVPAKKEQIKALVESGFGVYEGHMKAVADAMKGPYKEAKPKLDELTDPQALVKRAQEQNAGLAGQLIATLLPTYGRLKRQEGRIEARLGGVKILAAAAFDKATTGKYVEKGCQRTPSPGRHSATSSTATACPSSRRRATIRARPPPCGRGCTSSDSHRSGGSRTRPWTTGGPATGRPGRARSRRRRRSSDCGRARACSYSRTPGSP